MIDREFIKRKIDLIEQNLQRLTELKGLTFDEVAKDFFKYSALKLVLMEIIGRAIDINEHLIAEISEKDTRTPLSYRETFLSLVDFKILPEEFALEISKSAGFRNAIVHDYNNLDKYIVYTTIDESIVQYTQYCHYIIDYLDSHNY